MEEGEGRELVERIGCNELLVMQRGGRSARSRLAEAGSVALQSNGVRYSVLYQIQYE